MMSSSHIPFGTRLVDPVANHSVTSSDFAILCIEGNNNLCGGKWTPLFAEKAGLFEGSGRFLSGARATSCEAWARCASIQKGEHRPTIDPALTLPGQRQRLLPGGRPTCL